MADEDNDPESKTEEATEKRIQDSLEKGQVPHSKEAATLASMLGILIGIVFFVQDGALQLKSTLETFLDQPSNYPLRNGADAAALMSALTVEIAHFIGPIVIIMAVAGLAAHFLQNQPQMVADRIEPKLERISITKGFKRIFGIQGQVEFLKGVAKLLIVGAAGYFAIGSSFMDLINSLYMDSASVPGVMIDLIVRFLSGVVAAVAVLVGADIAWSRFSWHRDLRMTRQEVKDELKQSEGDPVLKSRLRSLQRDRSRQRMMASVPRATVVIANPTHYSVALRYVREEGGAPLVLAKGKDLIALKIRAIAEEHNIPVYEDRALARSLYASVEVDKMIPPEFYKAVAGVILFLQQRGKQRARAS